MILDTCALLWLASGERHRISDETLGKIEQAPEVNIVSITGFEIGLKHQVGKLDLATSPEEWINLAVAFHQLEIIQLDLETCLRASQLPPIHKDPYDRFIIAAAMIRSMPVVTTDRRFTAYGVEVIN